MKILHIALKDLVRSLRSAFALVMMFVAPVLITAIIYFAFGGLGSGQKGFELPTTRLQVADLDRPLPSSGDFAAGRALLQFLQSEGVDRIVQVTEAGSEAEARAAVERKEADVALIIPPGLTAAVMAPAGRATIVLYQDPTLTIGPALVKGIVGQFVDGINGARIAATVVAGQLSRWGHGVDQATVEQVATRYAAWAQELGQRRAQGDDPGIERQLPPSTREPADQRAAMIAGIMAGQIIFFAFYTGAATAESILREHEEGTLARLSTTPTPAATILGGKFAGVFVTLVVQVAVLLAAAGLLFRIRWGQPLPVLLVTLAMIVAAAGFGLFVMSFVKNTRQAGAVFGGVLTVTGMAGGLFTTGFQNLPSFYTTINLFTPHGWALRGWRVVLAGGGVGGVLMPVLVTLGLGTAFFAIGALLFRRRFR